MDSAQISDRELLELAAKAAGIETHGPASASGLLTRLPFQGTTPAYCTWNPLVDDADALRLAVSVGLSIMFDGETVQVSADDGGESCTAFAMEPINSSEGATRRAIVRAAAAIGAKP